MPRLSGEGGRLRNPSAKRLIIFKLIVFFIMAGTATGDGRATAIGLASTVIEAVDLSRILAGLGNASISRHCWQLHLCPTMKQSLSVRMW